MRDLYKFLIVLGVVVGVLGSITIWWLYQFHIHNQKAPGVVLRIDLNENKSTGNMNTYDVLIHLDAGDDIKFHIDVGTKPKPEFGNGDYIQFWYDDRDNYITSWRLFSCRS